MTNKNKKLISEEMDAVGKTETALISYEQIWNIALDSLHLHYATQCFKKEEDGYRSDEGRGP
jgi:hypothetical protein